MSEQSEALKRRTLAFAVSILHLVDLFGRAPGAQTVARQLAKSATSVGANYRAACTARSRAEFAAKLCIVNEESDESVYWLQLAEEAQYASSQTLMPLIDEAVQLRAIFGSSLSTARRKSNNQMIRSPMTK
jgi:four helix bundle protein